MEKLLGVVRVHKKLSISNTGNNSIQYRIVIPGPVLKRLEMSNLKYLAFRKIKEDIQIIKITGAPSRKINNFMELRRLGKKNRICLPDNIISHFNIADGDYLKFIERRKNDIRLCKLNVDQYYSAKKQP